LVGLWIGDGDNSSDYITNNDAEVVTELERIATEVGGTLKRYQWKDPQGLRAPSCPRFRIEIPNEQGLSERRTRLNPIRRALMSCRFGLDKQIPDDLLFGNRQERLETLAGIIDADGSLNSADSGYQITMRSERLIKQIAFLARSLGLAAYVRPARKGIKSLHFEATYWQTTISGHTEWVPCRISRKRSAVRRQKKSVLRTGFSVEAIGEGEFFGFTLDGDGRFLLGDFTVTHNSWFACSWPNPFVILFDPGSATHDRLNVPYAAVSGWAEVERYWLRALEQRRISELVQSIEDEAGNHPYADYKVETLVLDSLTFLVDDNLLELGGGGAKDVGQQGWDTYYSRVLRFLNAARRCARPEPRNPNAETYHLVATVHENVATTGEHGEYQEVKNAIQGKMNGRIAAFLDGHYLTERVVKGDIIEYFIRTKPSRRQIAGRGKEVITVTRDCKGDTIIGSDKMPTRLPNNYEAFARAWGWIK